MPKKKASSPKKLSTKAATQTRSTTSSTTAKTAKKKAARKKKTPAKKQPEQSVEVPNVESPQSSTPSAATFLRATDTPQTLSDEIQYAYMTLLSRGASPAAACSQLGILLAEVIWTLEQAPEFASMVDRVQELLSQNVAAALYRSAMEGSVSAQNNYLKAYPPPGTSPEEGATTGDSMTDPELDLTEEELIEYLKAEATAFLAEFDQERPSAENS